MRFHRSHLVFDGLTVGLLTLTSFGIFFLVSAQTDLLAPAPLPPPPVNPVNAAVNSPLPPPPPPPDGSTTSATPTPTIAPTTASPSAPPQTAVPVPPPPTSSTGPIIAPATPVAPAPSTELPPQPPSAGPVIAPAPQPASPPAAPPPAPTKSVCGDGFCDGSNGENGDSCPADCRVTTNASPAPVAGQPSAAPAPEIPGVPGSESGLPDLCRLKGVTVPEACKALMETMLSAWQAPPPVVQAPSASSGGNVETPVAAPATGFDAMLPKPCLDQGVTDASACLDLMVRNFPRKTGAAGIGSSGQGVPQFVPWECYGAGITDAAACQTRIAERAVLPRCKDKGAATPAECQALIVADDLPAECKDKGVFDEKACRTLFVDAFMPKSCKDAGVTDQAACDAMLLDKHGRPKGCGGIDASVCWKRMEAGQIDPTETSRLMSATRGDLPDACASLGAKDLADCGRLAHERYVPPECRDAGIFTADACDEHLFETYGAAGTDAAKAALAACGGAAVDPDVCRRQLEMRHFPKQCLDLGVTDAASCRDLLTSMMPAECRDAGAASVGDCEAMLRKKYVDPACAAQGVTDPAACEELAYGRLAAGVVCEGLDPDRCALAAKGRHLGGIMAAQKKNDDIGKVMDEAAGADGEFELDALAARGSGLQRQVADIMPLADGRTRWRALRSNAAVAMTGGDSVDAAPPRVLTFDTDGDGVPDDVETRLGTDPTKSDTDGDGVPDAEQLKAKSSSSFAPIDQAILGGGAVGQPRTEGTTDAALTVAIAGPATLPVSYWPIRAAQAAAPPGHALKGRAPVGTRVVALYVYSDLPILVTTSVDESGQWTYTLDGQLKDGMHEVYVAINDSTGKVVKKSEPLSFMVSAASAATAPEAVPEAGSQAAAQQPAPQAASAAVPPAAKTDAQANAAKGSAQQTDIMLFAIGGGVLLVAAAVIAFFLLRPRRSTGGAGPGPQPPQ